MISGQQLKQVLSYSFTNGTSFMAPIGTFIVTPSAYTTNSLPASVTLSGSLIPNNAVNITWTITDSLGVTLLTGLGNSSNYTLPTVPNTVGNKVYNWNITYQDGSGNNYSVILSATVYITVPAQIGQLNGAGVNITVPNDLTPAIEATLTSTDKPTLINLFDITASNTGRIVIVIPDSYGTVSDIQDNTDSTVLSQFNVVTDPGNNRKIYVGTNAVTPATYNYKIIFV